MKAPSPLLMNLSQDEIDGTDNGYGFYDLTPKSVKILTPIPAVLTTKIDCKRVALHSSEISERGCLTPVV